MGALRATLAEEAFEALGEMPETRRMSTTAERSAGCGVWSVRTGVGGVSGRDAESRQRLLAAWSAPSRGTAMDFSQMICKATRFKFVKSLLLINPVY